MDEVNGSSKLKKTKKRSICQYWAYPISPRRIHLRLLKRLWKKHSKRGKGPDGSDSGKGFGSRSIDGAIC
ncbi:hypothetical protein H5410_043111 [Solanum commersonii]|uniref:Uncharacterized protein n=1 Tax=Solanum commersonii TaxID=4109 RepID=A0A9J5XXJ1_SOLCO|nr:hypothetical protein H5410_043111 [Solanum commersonii]